MGRLFWITQVVLKHYHKDLYNQEAETFNRKEEKVM